MHVPQARSLLFKTLKVKRRLVATKDEDATIAYNSQKSPYCHGFGSVSKFHPKQTQVRRLTSLQRNPYLKRNDQSPS